MTAPGSAAEPPLLSEAAPAKINLGLRTGALMPDGRRQIEGPVAFVEVGDRLVFRPADTLTLEVVGPFAGALAQTPGADNLVMRAARDVASRFGCRDGAAITLHKHLPVASGIGGGSADAAATLRGLSRLWGLTPAAGALEALAAGLGADVPVCVGGRAAMLMGTGEQTRPVGLPGLHLVLANDGVAVPTAEVYRAHARRSPQAPALVADPRQRFGLADLAGLENALTAAALEVHPGLAGVAEALMALPGAGPVRMSGSGGTWFALFADADAAAAGARALAAAHPGWWVVATRTPAG